jgi:RNA polymerase sigma-70 factor (ECF subfamily)
VTKFDDHRLVNGLRKGCSEACGELVHRHYQAIFRFLAHLTRDAHLAEDLTQETFGAAWERIASFEGRSSLATWLHRIAYTKFIDCQRAHRRESKSHQGHSSLRTSAVDPFESVMAEDEARRLYEGLNELDSEHRTLLVLHYLQGLSYREIATVLDEPSGTVKWRMTEALDRLRLLLGDKASSHATTRTI